MKQKLILVSMLFLPLMLAGASCSTATQQDAASEKEQAAVNTTDSTQTPTPAVENSATPQATPSAENFNTNDGIGGGETDTNSSIDTSDWLTYENTDYGFSLKYPTHWNAKEELIGGLDIEQGDVNISGDLCNIHLLFPKKDVMDKAVNDVKQGIATQLFHNMSVQAITINDINGITYQTTVNEKGDKSAVYHFVLQDKTVELLLYTGNEQNMCQQIFDTMVHSITIL